LVVPALVQRAVRVAVLRIVLRPDFVRSSPGSVQAVSVKVVGGLVWVAMLAWAAIAPPRFPVDWVAAFQA